MTFAFARFTPKVAILETASLPVEAFAGPLDHSGTDALIVRDREHLFGLVSQPGPVAALLISEHDLDPDLERALFPDAGPFHGMAVLVVLEGEELARKKAFLRKGAADVIPASCDPVELGLRIQAALRLALFDDGKRLSDSTIALLLNSKNISPQQKAILRLLADGRGRTVTRDEIRRCIGGASDDDSRVIDVLVSRLRKILSDRGLRIEVERGKGYRLGA